jgi:hypothetical protein
MDQDARELLRALAAPFAAEDVSWRVGHTKADKSSGLALAYIDARAVADRLDEVCGLGWRCTYPTVVRSAVEGRRGSVVVCAVGIRVGDEWIERCDGAGDTAVEAEKGSLSDAFKRAAARWGVGRYLYGFPSPWVKIVQHGKSYAIARDELPKLAQLSTAALDAFRRDPKAFRAPPPEEEPERPAFRPEEPPARPAPPRPPSPSPGAHGLPYDAHIGALRSAASLTGAVDVVLRARRELAGEHLAVFDTAYGDILVRWAASYAEQRQPEAIEALAQALGTAGQGPAKVDAPRVRAALDKARREARA